ncbi:MAG: methionyl-tRNA formyltransferase [Ignavibacteria bacterium]|nr:methionyl-tRNA formyltransferase [Ignavibacteria bacterium]
MRILFMGTPGFAVPSLNILVQNNYDICGVVTVPDKKKGRGLNLSYSDVKKFSIKHSLNILQPDNLRDPEFIKTLTDLKPDLILVVAFKILPEEVFTIPKYGSVNLHASLLPKFRGAAPINHALINGETESGVTTFFLKKKVDTGNIILQKKINIDKDDDAGTLHDKLSELGAESVLETVRLIEAGNVIPQIQNDSDASPAPKIFKENCIIDWNQNACKIHDFIRGLSPYPAAFTFLNNRSVKIFRSALTGNSKKETPGSIAVEEKKLLVSCLDNMIEILELQTEGKKRIPASEFINGLDKSVKLFFTNRDDIINNP